MGFRSTNPRKATMRDFTRPVTNQIRFESLESRQMMSASPAHAVPGEWILSLQPAATRKIDVPALVEQASSRAGVELSVKRALSVRGLSVVQSASRASLK